MSLDGFHDGPVFSRQEKHANIWGAEQQKRMLAMLLRPQLGRAKALKIAGALVDECGSLPAVLAAPAVRLLKVPGVGPRVVHHLWLTLEIGQRTARQRIELTKPIYASWSHFIDYCRSRMAFESVEQFRIIFLDKKNRLIAEELHQTGTVDHTPVYPREVIKRSLELSATGLILLHNHPSGDPAPSSADVRVTREIADIGKPMGIILQDHIIIGKHGHVSLRELKLI